MVIFSQCAKRSQARRCFWLGLGVYVMPTFVCAQVPPVYFPDAGTILNIYKQRDAGPELPQSTLPPTSPQKRQEGSSQSTLTVKLKRFIVEGAKLISNDELLASLADFEGQELSFSDLGAAVARIDAAYRERGYFLSRAYLPMQDITNGEIRIAVIEGRYSEIDLVDAPRMPDDTLRKILEANGVRVGEPVTQEPLERSLILAERYSGGPVISILRPGETLGTSSLRLTPTPEVPFAEFSVGGDNYGSRYSGEQRLVASASLNNLTGIGDSMNLSSSYASGASSLYAGYQRPIDYSGLTVGINGSYYEYELCCQFSASQSTGSASVIGLQAGYPLILKSDHILNLGMSLEHKQLTDRNIGGISKDKAVNLLSFSSDGTARVLSGQMRYRAQLTIGEMNIKGPPIQILLDRLTAESEGGYAKLSGMLEHTVSISDFSYMSLRFSGQFSQHNLDSSEKMILGGVNGIRAYPEGEAAADRAWLGRLDWVFPIQRVPGRMAARVFTDLGYAYRNADTQSGIKTWSYGENNYHLAGWGMGVNWSIERSVNLSVYAAKRIGDNPGQDYYGHDTDGRAQKTRLWFSANLMF